MPQDLLQPPQPTSSPLERLEIAVDSMTTAQNENTNILKGVEPVMEALVHSYVQGADDIKKAISSIQDYISKIEPVQVNQEAIAGLIKLNDTFSNPDLFTLPEPKVITDSQETVKAIRDLIKSVDEKPLEVNLENDFSKLEKSLSKIEKLIKIEIPIEDGKVLVKLSDADLKKLGKAFALPIQVGTASEDTLRLIQAQLDNMTFVDGVLQTTAGSGGGGGSGDASASNQVTGNNLLASIDTKVSDVATQTTLALIKAKTDNLDTALSGIKTGTDKIPSSPATSTKQSDGSQKSQIVDGSGNVIGATSNALDVNIKSGVTQPISASSLPLPSGAATAAKQPALGTAGSASSDVLTVQGIASMTPLKVDGSGVTQPVSLVSVPSHAVTNAGTFAVQATLSAETTKVIGTINIAASQTVGLGAGSAIVGKVGIDQTTPGTTNAVAIAQIGANTVATGNGVVGTGVQRVAIASDNTPFATKIDQTTLGSTNGVTPVAATTGGATPYKLISAASTNATSVKSSTGQIYSISGFNINAAVRYLKIYNKASAPTVGTDTPVHVYPIPGSTTGGGFTLSIPVGQKYSTGIAFAITTGIADADTGAVAASEIVVNLDYI